jgi:uncharacterized membrane-anchored protein
VNELETVKLLTQLATGGLAMVFVSWLLERVPAFQAISSEAKAWTVLMLTLIVSLASQAALNLVPPEVLLALEPYVKVALGVITAWLTSQTYHAVQKRVSKQSSAQSSAQDEAQDEAQG